MKTIKIASSDSNRNRNNKQKGMKKKYAQFWVGALLLFVKKIKYTNVYTYS